MGGRRWMPTSQKNVDSGRFVFRNTLPAASRVFIHETRRFCTFRSAPGSFGCVNRDRERPDLK